MPFRVVEAVADDEAIRDLEADVAHRNLDLAARRLRQEGADLERRGAARGEVPHEVGERQARVDDVLDDEDVAALERRVEVLEDAHDAGGVGGGAVARDRHEVHLAGHPELAHQVGDEEDRAFEDADEEQLLACVVGGDLRRKLGDAATQVIFWGASWADPNFAGDKIKGIDSWYTGFGGSNYAATSNEYKGSNGQVSSSVSYFGSQVDTSAAPKGAPKTSAILAEVCSHITNPVTSGYYAVYVDTPRGHAGYCAWHSWGQCNGVNVQFAFFFNLDNDPNCSPDVNNGHSQGLAALANVSGHELSEARTDPRGDGWFDSSGEENGDKCAWAFNVPSVTFSNGTKWQIQGEWSNHAYDTNTGYPNLSGQNGCLDGH